MEGEEDPSGFFCTYNVMNRHAGKTMKDILKDFNPNQKKIDGFLLSKMTGSPMLKRLPGQKGGSYPKATRNDSPPRMTRRSRT